MAFEMIVVATLWASAVSFVGISFIFLNERYLRVSITLLARLAAGALLAAVFLSLLPSALLGLGPQAAMIAVFAGVVGFFVTEKSIGWHHHHDIHTRGLEAPLGWRNYIGDGIHNLCDGVAIGSAFLVSQPAGMIATLAVIMHEIPQEIGDFGLMLRSGFDKQKAIVFNAFSALLLVSGGVGFFAAYYYLLPFVQNLEFYGMAFACGMFLYIAITDLIPDVHKDTPKGWLHTQLALVLLGIMLIASVAIFVK
jgi:zinc and cadmium transporter